MSLVDTLKGLLGKGKEAASQNAGKINESIDKAGSFIDEKTGGKYKDAVDKVQDAAKNAVDKNADKGAEGDAPPA